MISCGEPSGDLYAGALAREIARIAPATIVSGFGSERLREAGASLVGDFKGLSVTGLLEVARVLPRTYAMYRRLLAEVDASRPDVFVPIDFPDFNFRLAAAIRKRGIPVVYYIGPQLWAWRPGRLKTMQRIADRVLVIFPFEEAI
jgi:lipid-A-disaccharide synthase